MRYAESRARTAKAEQNPEAPPIRPFSRSLPMHLLRAREQLMECFRPHLRKHGFTDQQWRVIRALVEVKEADMNELSTLCCISPPSLSRIVPRLEEDGLVRRALRADDQRYTTVSLTNQGRALFQTMAYESVEIYESIMQTVGHDQIEELYKNLDNLIRTLAEWKAE